MRLNPELASILVAGRYIDFYNSDNSIDIADAKSAAKHKDDYDAKSLAPVLNNFFSYHPNFK